MRIKQVLDNGNIAALNKNEVQSHRNINNRSWRISNNSNNRTIYNNSHRTVKSTFNSNCNDSYTSETSELCQINSFDASPVDLHRNTSNGQFVCNKQYRLNTQNRNINLLKSCRSTTELANLEGATETLLASCESFLGVNPLESNASTGTSPIDEERAFDQSDTDEMSENGVHLVPRGIVNPNYPGFQHLAHTLQQDYSSNIENFYQSENDMTDDDVDIEITDITYEHEPNHNVTVVQCKNINNNNNDDSKHTILTPLKSDVFTQLELVDSNTQNEIPDLLKTISKNDNCFDCIDYDLNCTDTDIENNFQTTDIIGDFNKEIQDEIKKLLNYNINIQDDLEELRKDIKDTFSKPIENTINNISDVVNHVIKKLVETQSDDCDQCEDKLSDNNLNKETEQISNIEKENETNTNIEMNLSRPTFLLIENNSNNKITDAFLSDGKDEIHIYDNEYDTEKISSDVENTIKQLSTELRKIIPKLDEMRERDKLWNENKKGINSVITDGNFNEIPSSSKCYDNVLSKTIYKTEGSSTHETTSKMGPVKTQIEPVDIREQHKETSSAKNSSQSAHSNTSVRKNENTEEYDLGSFDVYNIETALPKLDLDAIENHIKAAKEAERRMFENLVNNIKRRFSKPSVEVTDNNETIEVSAFKRNLYRIKSKFIKTDAITVPIYDCQNISLSPRAIGTAECAETEIEWPVLTDHIPNILDKFTKIVTITDDVPYDKKKRNDREEIRRRLAMGAEAEEYYSMGHIDRPGKKPSLHSRLQNGMNLQICFMNETASDNESQTSDLERNVISNNKNLSRSSIFSKSNYSLNNHPYQTRPLSVNITKHDKISTLQSGAKLRPSSLTQKFSKSRSSNSLGHIELKESDFYALQATLQTEARIALAQAKEMARIQMERERRSRPVSPVTEMLRRSMEKANAPLASDRRRVSRQLLTDMNIAQLQVIVNELHSQIETLNDSLVKLLMARDELHMGQDSMLVDIEDLTRYLGVKEQSKKTKGTSKSGVRRLTSLVHK